MYESIIDRIESLERSNRFWKVTAIFLAMLLLSLVGTSLTFFAMARQDALRALEAAQVQQMAARAEAEVARARAEQALQKAKKNE